MASAENEIQHSTRRVMYAAVSFACPIAAVVGVSIYQSMADSEFWDLFTPEYSAAGAMMAFSELVELVLFTIIGCLVGLVLGALSFRLQSRTLGIGLAALVFNALPLVLAGLIFLLILIR